MDTQTNLEVNINKGEKVDLTKTNPGLNKVSFGISWDLQPDKVVDLDAFAVPVKADEKQHSPVLYFGSPKVDGKLSVLDGALIHSGDNLTGAGDGDDETITVDLSKVPADVDSVVVGVNIFNSTAGNMGQVKSAACRVYNAEKPTENIINYDLNEDYSSYSGLLIGKIYRKEGQWKFQAMGEGCNGDINTITAKYRN